MTVRRTLPPASWWQTTKQRLVIVTGGLSALAAALRMIWLMLGDWPFVAASLIEEGDIREVSATTLRPGQRVQVRPGDRAACDGRILAGQSDLDESPINGESLPRSRTPGDDIFAGTVNLDAVLEVEVSRSAKNNTIARVTRLVEEAQATKAPVARFIDRFAR